MPGKPGRLGSPVPVMQLKLHPGRSHPFAYLPHC